MAAPYYDNVMWPTKDGLRVPTERAFFKATSTQSETTLATFGELDLGSVAGTITLNTQQAGATYITITPSAAVTLVYPGCLPGFKAAINNLGSFSVTAEVSGNTSNTAVVPSSTIGTIAHDVTTGGIDLVSASGVSSTTTLTVSGNGTIGGTLGVTGVVTPSAGIAGLTAGAAASAGIVGQVISSAVAVGSPVSLTNATPANVTSISLMAGDWDVDGNVNYTASSASTAAGSLWVAGINTTSATIPTDGSEVQQLATALTTTTFKSGVSVTRKVINVSTTTTVYLVAEATFTAGTVGAYGTITARRVR
jgi:hypothetical protein